MSGGAAGKLHVGVKRVQGKKDNRACRGTFGANIEGGGRGLLEQGFQSRRAGVRHLCRDLKDRIGGGSTFKGVVGGGGCNGECARGLISGGPRPLRCAGGAKRGKNSFTLALARP